MRNYAFNFSIFNSNSKFLFVFVFLNLDEISWKTMTFLWNNQLTPKSRKMFIQIFFWNWLFIERFNYCPVGISSDLMFVCFDLFMFGCAQSKKQAFKRKQTRKERKKRRKRKQVFLTFNGFPNQEEGFCPVDWEGDFGLL